MNKITKEVISWVVPITIIAILYLTGLHTEVIGRMQQALLATGLIQPDTSASPPTLKASYDVRLINLKGETKWLGEHQGKVILINLWATWCPPCVAEMPGLQALYEKTSHDNIEFVMISLDEDMEKVRKFIGRKGYTFPVYMLAGSLPELYETNTIPTTFVISASGMLAMKKQGMADYNSSSFKNYLLQLKEE